MTDLPALPSLGIVMINAPRRIRRALMTTLTIQLALLGPVRVLDGGNSFDGLKLARELRRQTRAYHTHLASVSVARAFTCYQMERLLSISPVEPCPTLVLELLSTFEDENVPFYERKHLLEGSLPHLKRVSRLAPVFLSVDMDDPFAELLQSATDLIWQFEEANTAAIQGSLF
jgi:hypothetical protein